jgi:hypothetical protein
MEKQEAVAIVKTNSADCLFLHGSRTMRQGVELSSNSEWQIERHAVYKAKRWASCQ